MRRRTRMISAHPHPSRRKYVFGGTLNEAYTPFMQGKEAAHAGKPMTACPYGMGRQLPSRAACLDGWQDVTAAARAERFARNARALGVPVETDEHRTRTFRTTSRAHGRLA